MNEEEMVITGSFLGEPRFNAGLICTRHPGQEKLKAEAVEFEFGPVRIMIPIDDWDKLVAKAQAERDSFAATGKF